MIAACKIYVKIVELPLARALFSAETVEIAGTYRHAHLLQIGEQLVLMIDEMLQIA
jgi:hypothetical protein